MLYLMLIFRYQVWLLGSQPNSNFLMLLMLLGGPAFGCHLSGKVGSDLILVTRSAIFQTPNCEKKKITIV